MKAEVTEGREGMRLQTVCGRLKGKEVLSLPEFWDFHVGHGLVYMSSQARRDWSKQNEGSGDVSRSQGVSWRCVTG